MTFEIFLDILIIALLNVGIVYAIILEHRLSHVRENKREMARLIEQFYQASRQTAEEFVRLEKMENEARQMLKDDLERAALMRDELTFLLNKIQENNYVTSAKITVQAKQSNQTNKSSFVPNPRSQAEQDLIQALNVLK